MGIQRIEAPAQLQVKAGRKVQIPAVPVGAQKHERLLLFVIVDGGGEVEKNGIFTAPIVYTNAISKVKVMAAFDNTKTAEVEIAIQPISIEKVLAPSTLQVKAGKTIQIRASAVGAGEHEKGLAFFLEEGDGEIDFAGTYSAPITAVDTTAKVKVVSTFDDTKSAMVKIDVKAITVKKVDAPKTLQVKSGKTVQIHATAIGDDRNLLYSIDEGEGEIDPRSTFTAPTTFADVVSKVRVASEFDPTKFAIVEITTKAMTPMKILPSANLDARGGQTIQFDTKFELPKSIVWKVADHGRDTGNIDAKTGLYKAPELISEQKTVKVKAIDQNRANNMAEVEITLLPVEMKTGTQRRIHTGEESVQLNIKSRNDLCGLNNFTCQITSRPEVGRVLSGGIYLPPGRVNRIETIKVEATSNLDKTKKTTLKFEVGFPLCPKCKIKETNADGICMDCGQVLNSLVKSQKCPRCKSSRWNGVACPTCDYPKPWKVK